MNQARRIAGQLAALLVASLFLMPSAHAQKPGADEGDKGDRPSLTGLTKTKDKTDVNKQTLESIQESIANQKQVIELSERSSPDYPKQVIALADFYWDLAEWYGLQVNSEAIEKPLYDAQERGDDKEVARLQAVQDEYRGAQAKYREETITIYRSIIRKFSESPKLPEIRYFLAYNLTDMGRTDEGVATYTELIGAHPDSPYVPDALVNIGEYYFEINDFRNALRLYTEAQSFKDAPIFGYAIYKEAWCHYNLADYRESMKRFVEVIHLADERAKAGARGAIKLKTEAQNDVLLPYSKEGDPGKAITFLKAFAVDRYLELAGRLAAIYTEQNEYERSTKLLRALIKEARAGNIHGKDQSYLVLRFQRQIVNNAVLPGDKPATVAEISELIRLWLEIAPSAPAEFIKTEQQDVKQIILEIAAEYHKEYIKTREADALMLTQMLYDEYLRVFRKDENAYEISMNNALLLLAREKWSEAAQEFEKVIAMNPTGAHADDAAERSVVAYLKTIQIANQRLKAEATDDIARRELSSEETVFIHAIDRWMGIIAKNGPNPKTASNIPMAQFGAAKVLYNANQFAEASPRFAAYIDANPKHKLVNDARRHLLSGYNLSHDVDALRTTCNEYKSLTMLPADIVEDCNSFARELNYQQCFRPQKEERYAEAAACFKAYADDNPTSARAPAALSNAGANYFEAKDVERALETKLHVYKTYNTSRDPEIKAQAVKALFDLAEMFRQTTVYDQAANIYESLAANHKKHDLAKIALQRAGIFRKTLGENKKAIDNLGKWLRQFGGEANAPAVHLDVISILEKEGRHAAVGKAVKLHLRQFKVEDPSIRLQVLNKRALADKGRRKWRQANQGFDEVLDYYRSLKDAEQEKLSLPAISAVAEAHFNLGDQYLREATKIKLTGRTREAVTKNLKKKLGLMNKAKGIYETVISYGHPGWMIAAWTQLGIAYQNLTDAVENAPVPARIRHIPEVVQRFEQKMADDAKGIREQALHAYRSALDVAKKERWFNEYSEKAEAAIAQLDLTDLSIKEFRLKPSHLSANAGHATYYDRQLTGGN